MCFNENFLLGCVHYASGDLHLATKDIGDGEVEGTSVNKAV